MSARSHIASIALFAAASYAFGAWPASAKPLDQLSDSELVDVLLSAPGTRKREAAATLLGERRSEIAADALGRACLDDREGEVCDRALDALMAIGSEDAIQQVAEVLRSNDVESPRRRAALAILLAQDPDRVDYFLGEVLCHYRTLDTALVVDLLECVRSRELQTAGDAAVFIASDELAHIDARLRALDAAEKLEHPRLFEAYVALASDDDKTLRARCAEGLGNPAYPGSAVVPTLMHLAGADAAAPVRAAALASLRFYAHPGLLRLLHNSVLHEANPVAWATALVLLEAVATPASIQAVERLLKDDDRLPDEVVLRLIRILVRVGDSSTSPILDALSSRSNRPGIAQAAKDGARLLEASPQQRMAVVSRWSFGVGVFRWDPDGTEHEVPPLGVELDAEGVLVPVE